MKYNKESSIDKRLLQDYLNTATRHTLEPHYITDSGVHRKSVITENLVFYREPYTREV